MQNLMPQLSLPNKTVQQQPKTGKPSGKSGKSGSGDDDFRSLLQSSSKDTVSSEQSTEVSETDATGQSVQNAQGKPDKKNGLEDEEILQDTGMQAFQLLMMGGSQLEDLEILTELPGDLAVQQPAVEEVTGPVSVQVTDTDLAGMVQSVKEEGTVVPVQDLAQEAIVSEPAKDPGAAEVFAADVKAEMQQPSEAPKKEVHVEAGEKLPGESVQKRHVEVQTEAGVHRTTDRKMSGTAQHVQGPEEKAGTDQMDQVGHFVAQSHAAEGSLQQNVFQDRLQQGQTEAVPTVHIQAASPQELMDNLMDQLKVRASMREQEFEIQLHPENLGKLAIKVAYTAEKVSISIVCSNERTMELLSSGAKNIAQIMEENLGAPTMVMVDQEESDYLEQYNNQENSRQQQQDQEKEKKKTAQDEHQDFLQQLRLGLI